MLPLMEAALGSINLKASSRSSRVAQGDCLGYPFFSQIFLGMRYYKGDSHRKRFFFRDQASGKSLVYFAGNSHWNFLFKHKNRSCSKFREEFMHFNFGLFLTSQQKYSENFFGNEQFSL